MDGGKLRIDKWLWYARLVKTRTRAQKLAVSGRVRKNRDKIASASDAVRVGDVLTIGLDRRVRILRVLALATRRGPAAEAQTLYEDLTPPAPPRTPPGRTPAPGLRPSGAGRPTKRDRRRIDALRDPADD